MLLTFYKKNREEDGIILRSLIVLWFCDRLSIENPSDFWSVCLKCIIWCFTENLALHKPAWQSTTHESHAGDRLVAERAVDGLYTDLRWEGGQCAGSALGQRTAEWRVDLGGVRSIHHIFIQYMTGNRVWGTVCFKAYTYIIYWCYTDYISFLYSFRLTKNR